MPWASSSASAGLGRVISGGSSTIQRRPSRTSVKRGSARSLVRRRARFAARRTSLRSPGLAAGAELVDVEPLERAGQQRLLGQVPHLLPVRPTQRRTASSQSPSPNEFCRPATHTLVTSRRRSHSQAPGCASSKSLRSKTRSRSGEA